MNETYETGDCIAERAERPKLVWDSYGAYETLDSPAVIRQRRLTPQASALWVWVPAAHDRALSRGRVG